MTDVEQYKTLKELYEATKDENSASYSAFLRKLKRLAGNNTKTYNRVSRNLGIEPPRKSRRTKPVIGEFITYDGEGWDDKYVLLANSLGERISNPEGLSTVDCLEFLSASYPRRVKRVWFSFGYDVNHIIRDLNDGQLAELLTGRTVNYEGFRISYIPRKIFIVNNYRYYDCFSFFSTSFINVIASLLGPEAVTDSLKEGKSARGSFETWDLQKIIDYNDEELALLTQVLKKLQAAFQAVNVELTEWYGPGAVAKYWFREHDVYPKDKNTSGSIFALNGAYYGGRFEQLVLGKINNVYEYDIHSAYPSVMADMPDFKSWHPVKKFEDNPYSLWYISFDLRDGQDEDDRTAKSFLPLPVRAVDGRICYPLVGKGWYWYPEVRVMLDYFPKAKIVWHKGYIAETEGKPFAWVKELYDYRLQLKAEGNPSEFAIKVGLNSLYGKTAQRVGSSPFFSLAWAGYITSMTRAKLARAGYECGSGNVIGFATDALFTTKPIEVPISNQLGDWEASTFTSGTFFQSGVYRLIRANGSVVDRYRGSASRAGFDDIIRQLREQPYRDPRVYVTRFITHLLAMKAPAVYGPKRLQFIKVQHELQLDAPYKRFYHFPVRIRDMYLEHNYGAMLKQVIYSSPKVWVNDNNELTSADYFYGERAIRNFESNPPSDKDHVMQQLLTEAETLGDDYLASDLDELDIMEDELM